ncbi:MAG TPA: hypothetical protein VHY20_05355, partial [Pirellulales bacterium]|nr:hypothetical protein [Pirellulales bacterium]
FKVADLSRLQIMASAYEEDLEAVRALPPEKRRWLIDIKADPNDVPIEGRIDVIGDVIDPVQDAGSVIGWVDNSRRQLTVGQFIMASVALPADPNLVVVPPSAVVEEGDRSDVFVEVDAARREYRRQRVAIVRRQRHLIFVRSLPTPSELGQGCQPLAAGSRVINTGTLELLAELLSDEHRPD